jgi:hypothetical protein
MEKKESFNNLIDICMKLDEDVELTGNSQEIFRTLLNNYFFKQETYESKRLDNYIKNMEMPSFLKEHISLVDIDTDRLRSFIEGDSVRNSFCGAVMLSTEFLKSFYPHHTPDFKKMPPDIQAEILQRIKFKNQVILDAFDKMKTDKEADRGRKVVTLIALILKNIHLRTGMPFNKLTGPAESVIRTIFKSTDDIFNAQQRQLAELTDDKKIKELIKAFFVVKKFQDLTDFTSMFIAELERYKKRALRA